MTPVPQTSTDGTPRQHPPKPTTVPPVGKSGIRWTSSFLSVAGCFTLWKSLGESARLHHWELDRWRRGLWLIATSIQILVGQIFACSGAGAEIPVLPIFRAQSVAPGSSVSSSASFGSPVSSCTSHEVHTI